MACEECQAIRDEAERQLSQLRERCQFLEAELLKRRERTAGSAAAVNSAGTMGLCGDCGEARDLGGKCGCD